MERARSPLPAAASIKSSLENIQMHFDYTGVETSIPTYNASGANPLAKTPGEAPLRRIRRFPMRENRDRLPPYAHDISYLTEPLP